MRRSNQERGRPKPHSQAGSVAGEDADFSDAEPSESGSQGGRSNATGGSSKKWMTIEEREAAYNEARSRIFMGFEEKEKGKEKDLSGSSSSLSLVSISASTSGGGSSVDDLDESVGTPATESEWSAPITIPRDKKDGRRSGGSGNNSGNSSSRSLRSTAPAFNVSGSSSSRNSRAPSPSFQYASLYEPPASTIAYDMSQPPGQTPVPNYPAPWGYPFPSSAQNPVPYVPHYQHFYAPPYGWPHPQQNGTPPNADHPTPVDIYSHGSQVPPHAVQYANPYMWTNAHQPGPTALQHSQPPSQPRHPTHTHSLPAQIPVQYPGQYVSPYPYAMPGYYQPQPQHPPAQHVPPPPPHMVGQPIFPEAPHSMNGSGGRSHHINGNSPGHSRTSSRNSTGGPGVIGGGKRGGPPPRTAWSYGPGISMGGFGHPGNGGHMGGDVVGPRLSSTMRRTSGASSAGSGSTGNRTPAGDEASSSAVSHILINSLFSVSLIIRSDFSVIFHDFLVLATDFHFHVITPSIARETGLGCWA
jgi:hypothetical protein